MAGCNLRCSYSSYCCSVELCLRYLAVITVEYCIVVLLLDIINYLQVTWVLYKDRNEPALLSSTNVKR